MPDDSREMIELVAYMETAKSGMMMDLQQDVKDSLKRLTYLLDVHTFSSDDMELNRSTLLWPQGISPVFEENEQVCCVCVGACLLVWVGVLCACLCSECVCLCIVRGWKCVI